MRTTVSIDKLVHGGQGLASLADGRKVFVWNALPGETVEIRLIKSKRSYAEAIAEEIITSSADRIKPREENYLATSPWQIMSFDHENQAKQAIVTELFMGAHVELPNFELTHGSEEWRYRNKMEYSFWGDEQGLHLALHQRGSHGKDIVQGSELALTAVDEGARAVLAELNQRPLRAGDLKTVIVRANQAGEVVAALFVKLDSFKELDLPAGLKGLRVYFSNPKSPASVPTRLLQTLGDVTLQDELLGEPFSYTVDSFFQVNIPVFESALTKMKHYCQDKLVIDMYAGVGSIGLSLAQEAVTLVELDPASAAMARLNATSSSLRTEVIETSSEKALDYISASRTVIFDPPRAGLHAKIIDRLLEIMPPKILYLSCNPSTQARDLAKLQTSYEITYFEVFNFFPRTPHIETLAILEKS